MEAVATDATRFMATEIAMDSPHRRPKRSLKLHVADFKNVAGDDQVTLRVYLNSVIIAQSFEIYVYEIANDGCSMVDGTSDCHRLVPSTFEKFAQTLCCQR